MEMSIVTERSIITIFPQVRITAQKQSRNFVEEKTHTKKTAHGNRMFDSNNAIIVKQSQMRFKRSKKNSFSTMNCNESIN